MSDSGSPQFQTRCHLCRRPLVLPFAPRRAKLCDSCHARFGEPHEYRARRARRLVESPSPNNDYAVRILEGN